MKPEERGEIPSPKCNTLLHGQQSLCDPDGSSAVDLCNSVHYLAVWETVNHSVKNVHVHDRQATERVLHRRD